MKCVWRMKRIKFVLGGTEIFLRHLPIGFRSQLIHFDLEYESRHHQWKKAPCCLCKGVGIQQTEAQ